MIENEKDYRFSMYLDYYSQRHLQYLIALPCANREFSMLCSKGEERKEKRWRNLRCHRPQDLQFFWKCFHITEQKIFFNMYHSVARFSCGVPKTNLADRSSVIIEWNLHCHKDIVDYHLLIDIDATSHSEIGLAHQAAKEILIDLVSKKYNGIIITMSGMGFHILVPMNEVTKNRDFNPESETSIYREYKELAQKYHDEVSTLVDINIYDHRRLMKCPYSLAVYEDHTYVVHPFGSIEEFLNFDLKHYLVEKYVLTNNTLTFPILKWRDDEENHRILRKLSSK